MTYTVDEQRVHDVLADLAGDVAVDATAARPAATRALQRRARRRVQRRVATMAVVSLALVVATVAVIGVPTDNRVRTVASTVPRIPGRVVVRADLVGRWAPAPVAYDGRDVWLAHEDAGGGSRPGVFVERRSATTGRLLDRVHLAQESIFSIAVGDGSVWVAGGGDGGVPDTTVSRIDLASRRVVFTRTLSTPCACYLAVGAGGAWLGGESTRRVFRLDRTTGAIAATITLPGPSASIAVVAGKVQVGLDDPRVAVIDPAANTVERTLTITAPGQRTVGAILGISPIGSTGDSWALRTDGEAFEVVGNARVEPRPIAFLAPLVFSGASLGSDRLWGVSVDQLLFASTDGRTRGYANYSAEAHAFGRLVTRDQRFAPQIALSSLRDVVATGSTLWVVATDRVFVVAPP
jgi:hypothetical protein